MQDVRSLPEQLRKSYEAIYSQQVTESTMITGMITVMMTGIIGLLPATVHHCGAVIAHHVAAPNGNYNNFKFSQVTNRFNWQRPLSMNTEGI
jgi:hypothetical protein